MLNKHPLQNTFRAGFTLLELSIVLVIIGLLIGGIFVGQSLINNAKLNAVISEFNQFQTATQSFKQMYQALPGDMTNATSIWGSAGGTGSDDTCYGTGATLPVATCNGDGDGLINLGGTQHGEIYSFWKHLGNAKMIPGGYAGTSNGGHLIAGVTNPGSKYTPGLWSVNTPTLLNTPTAYHFTGADYGTGHVFLMGGDAVDYLPLVPVLTVKDAWSIDKKIDDGKPAMGNVLSSWTCTSAYGVGNSGGSLASTYTLSGTSPCTLVFVANF